MTAEDGSLGNFRFRLEIDGATVASFSEGSTVESEIGATQARTGVAKIVRTLPGRSVPILTLKHGVTSGDFLWRWYRAVDEGDMARRTVVVALVDEGGIDVGRWILTGAWPRSWVGASVDPVSGEVALEAIEIVFEGMQRLQDQA